MAHSRITEEETITYLSRGFAERLAAVMAGGRYAAGLPGLTEQGEPDEQPARLVERGGQSWESGTTEEVQWIQRGFRPGLTIASSVPPVFAAYATVVDPWDEEYRVDGLRAFDRGFGDSATRDGAWLAAEHAPLRQASRGWQVQQQLVDVLAAYGSRSWWLGYLDTGASDVVFEHVRAVTLYVGWEYALVKAGPEQALSWRLVLPDLMFPDDHTWCLSTGWDDSWTCIGGPAEMVDRLVQDPVVRARAVSGDQDATPPGHTAI